MGSVSLHWPPVLCQWLILRFKVFQSKYLIQTDNMDKLSHDQRVKMENWKGKYLMTSWENYAEFLEKLGVPLILRKLATMGTPIVEVTYDEETEEWNICRTSTIFYQIIKLRSVDFKFKLDTEFDEVTPDKREVRSIVTVDGDSFKHVSKAKKEGVTGHTVITEFKGDQVHDHRQEARRGRHHEVPEDGGRSGGRADGD